MAFGEHFCSSKWLRALRGLIFRLEWPLQALWSYYQSHRGSAVQLQRQILALERQNKVAPKQMGQKEAVKT